MSYRSVAMEEILLEGRGFDRFIFTYPLTFEAVRQSVQEVGLLHPVCLRQEEGGYRIIYGARRILACRALGFSEIPARVISANGVSDEQALLMSLEEDRPQRRYNPMEQARALEAFRRWAGWSHATLVQTLAPRLGLPPSGERVRQYLGLLNLEDALQVAIAEERLATAHGFLLASLPSEERLAIFHQIFETCQPSLQEGREIIEHLSDLKAILKSPVGQILRRPPIQATLSAAHLAPRRRCKLLRDELRRLRYPSLTSTEQRFSEELDALDMSKTWRVQHAPYFEENHLTFSARVQSVEELRSAVARLTAACDDERLQRLFKLVRGE